MSLREDIYNYEEKLSELKKEINELSMLYLSDPQSNSKLLSSKISSMKNEIQAINYQLELFKMTLPELAKNESTNVSMPSQNPSETALNNEPIKTQVVQENKTNSQSNASKNESTQNQKTEFKDFENTIGKSFMGILASILIFISFILFAKLLYPLLTDAIKIIAMYGISGLFTLFGLLKLKKHPKNKLFLSIAGCGVGALYISLIISNIYFKVIGDITLYLLILAWAIFTAYLSRLRSNIFSIIGQSGISIALIFGNALCAETNDINKFLVLNIFFVISAFLFNTSKIYSKNLANNVFHVFNLSLMTSNYLSLASNETIINVAENTLLMNIIPFILIAFIAYKFITAYMILKLSNENFDFTIINFVYIFNLLYILDNLFTTTTYLIIGFILMAVFLIINEIKFKNHPCLGRDIFQIILMIYITSCCFELNFIADNIGVCILAIPFIIYGFFKEDNLFKYAGLTELFIYIFTFDLFGAPHFIIGLIIFALLKYLIDTETKQYSNVTKIITYALFLFFGSFYIDHWLGTNYDAIEISIFIYLSIINLIASKSKFKNNFQTGEEENSTVIITHIINASLMLWSLELISCSTNYTSIVQTLIIFISLALFISNTRNLLEKHEGLLPGIYIGIKFTILLLVILGSWGASSFTVSISCLLFAILGIVLGFYLKQKSFRVYGLVLTMICTFKLIMIDMAYENSIGQVLSFFISGLLCLGINAMYNMLDKKFLSKDSDENQ